MMKCIKRRVVITVRIIAVIAFLVVAKAGIEYAYWMWKGANYTTKLKPIVLTEDAVVEIGGVKSYLPRGLVLYPLNELECSPEVYSGNEYKIYIEKDSLKARELTESEVAGNGELIYRLNCER